MIIRVATQADIRAMQRIRQSVRENKLTDPARITDQSYQPYLAASSAWVAESKERILGFAMVDGSDRSVWALFVDPAAEGAGVGHALHERIIIWSRDQGFDRLSLTTGPDTRAAHFYRARGWVETATDASGDLCFERAL